jgi:hypothetical protein
MAQAIQAPGEDERVLKRTGADMQNGWIGRHGTLYLTEARLLFIPTPLDRALRARRRQIMLDDLTAVERWPESPGTFPRDGRRPRIRLHAGDEVTEYLVGDLDAWIDLIELVYARRVRRGVGEMPRVVRTGHVNPLLDEE